VSVPLHRAHVAALSLISPGEISRYNFGIQMSDTCKSLKK
jgi:hypothetical protein